MSEMSKGDELLKSVTVQTINVQPSDVLVLMNDGVFSGVTKARLVEIMSEVWPHNKCVVLDGGIKLTVLRKETIT